jgi:phosphate starvation-inducible PhoH-like protein
MSKSRRYWSTSGNGFTRESDDQSEQPHPTALKIRRKVEGPTENHRNYIKAIRNSDITFCEGPAGTGKTYMAIGSAVHMLLSGGMDNKIKKIVISRPIVANEGAGPGMGFLPGELEAKAQPYMMPIFENLRKFCRDDAEYRKLTNLKPQHGEPLMEIVPLDFMRGRTFDNCFVILDESQNSTTEQMLMFLTRMGENCKVVVTGDMTQSDIEERCNGDNGLISALMKLEGKSFRNGVISVCYLDESDIMRHGLISEILEAWKGDEDEGEGDEGEGDEDPEDDGDDDHDGGLDEEDEEEDEEDPNPYLTPHARLKRHRVQKIVKNRITEFTTEPQVGRKPKP